MEYNINFILDEIEKIIRDNLSLFLLNDQYLVELKKYCKEDKDLKYTPYQKLIYFTEEALCDLINVDYLYDFRNLE